MRERLTGRSDAFYQNAGLAVWLVAFGVFVLGPTVIDPRGDGLWYGSSAWCRAS